LFQRHALAYETLYFQGYEQALRLIPRLLRMRLQTAILNLSAYKLHHKTNVWLLATPFLIAKLTTLSAAATTRELFILLIYRDRLYLGGDMQLR
jgi:hypothetical protein